MKRILSFLSVAVILSFVFVSCQRTTSDEIQTTAPEHFLGAELLPAEVYNALPKATTPDVNFKATVLSLNTPTPGDQGSEGSCVAWGTTFAGRSQNWNFTHGNGTSFTYSTNIFSPEYVYNQIKAKRSCGSGSWVTTGLDLLKTQGVCLWATMPYTNGTCTTMPSTAQKTAAANYKIAGYATVALNATSIKAQLNAGKAVIVAGPVSNGFMNLTNGTVLTTFVGSSLGGHCYIVVGYDDTKNAFKFQNSWGTSWASAGFGWINYNNVTTWWQEAYVIN